MLGPECSGHAGSAGGPDTATGIGIRVVSAGAGCPSSRAPIGLKIGRGELVKQGVVLALEKIEAPEHVLDRSRDQSMAYQNGCSR